MSRNHNALMANKPFDDFVSGERFGSPLR